VPTLTTTKKVSHVFAVPAIISMSNLSARVACGGLPPARPAHASYVGCTLPWPPPKRGPQLQPGKECLTAQVSECCQAHAEWTPGLPLRYDCSLMLLA
jgi:hypothetical protein